MPWGLPLDVDTAGLEPTRLHGGLDLCMDDPKGPTARGEGGSWNLAGEPTRSCRVLILGWRILGPWRS